jgi:hypothetical protein
MTTTNMKPHSRSAILRPRFVLQTEIDSSGKAGGGFFAGCPPPWHCFQSETAADVINPPTAAATRTSTREA